MARVLVNGVKLNVAVGGSGPPLVALHGFTGDMDTWHSFARAAARHQHTVVRIDLLGHGRSDCPSDPQRYSMERCAEDLIGVLDVLGIGRAAWMGYSLGGRIALGVALAAPERCLALVLEGGSPGLADQAERAQRLASDEGLARLLEERGVPSFVEVWEAQPLWASQRRLPPAERLRLRAQRLRNRPAGLAGSLRGIGTGAQPSYHHRLSGLPLPTLMVVGEEDSKFREIAQAMCRLITASQLAVIPEAGHTTHLEQPERFNRAVLDFLQRHRGTPGAISAAGASAGHAATAPPTSVP
ncbi:MAG: 2-succinyl-6-hydroxy-2,4-cyclohexadiene-1-carboxylate synthase [Dehalococcoidia bacterium]|nr:2-succinyl-6-hydroxy-2,4-cyclohexadiene-1-carboxylate synthase [Dehalococcoidia bacterium]